MILTPEMELYIRDNYMLKSGKDIAAELGINRNVVYRFMRANKLTVPADVVNSFRAASLRDKTTASLKEDAYIRKHYLTIPIKCMAKRLGRSGTFVSSRIRKLGLVIPPQVALQRKQANWIKKGAIPKNKGKRQIEYMSADAIERSKVSRFKNGNIPTNAYNEVGKITIRRESKGKREYKYICLSLGVWKPLHVHLWEQAYGPVPKGYCVSFKDGDSLHADVENLELISREENMRRNSGSINLTDSMVATYVAVSSKKVDKELKKVIMQLPDLIKAKRTQLLINRKIKNNGKKQISRPE